MNKYRLVNNTPSLAEDAHSITHLGRNVKKDEKVAIKILRKKLYFSQADCEKYREVQVLQELKHHNILKMLEFFNDSGELLMVMEYLPENVKRVMKKRDRPYSESETKIIMLQTLQGLSHLHNKGYMHRHMRPEILQCNDDASVVKISDFVMAKSTGDGQPLGEFKVSPCWYQAPEVMLGATNYSTKVDMWAVGCIMAELLIGKPIFAGSETADQMSKICEVIGMFTKSEWPDGSILAKQNQYKVTITGQPKGLGPNAGVMAGSDAKGLLSDLLVWNPKGRKTADESIMHAFLRSGSGVGHHCDRLMSAEDKLRLWRGKWEPELNQSSISEFDTIISGLAKRNGESQNNSRHTFPGFSQNTDGIMTPRGGGNSPRKLNNTLSKSSMVDDVSPPQARRSRQSISNGELFSSAGELSKSQGQGQMESFSPRRNNAMEDMDNMMIAERQKKADKMKQTNPLRYRDKHANDMKGILGESQPNRVQDQTGQHQGPGGGMNGFQRSSRNNMDDFQPGKIDDNRQPPPQISPRRGAKEVDPKSINHLAQQEYLKKNNSVKARDRYGDDFMRSLFGTKPAVKAVSDDMEEDEFTREMKRTRNDDFYKPSWSDSNKTRNF